MVGELWKRSISLHRGPAGEPGSSFTRDCERWMKGSLGMVHLSLRELCEGNLEGDSSTGDPERYAKYGSGN